MSAFDHPTSVQKFHCRIGGVEGEMLVGSPGSEQSGDSNFAIGLGYVSAFCAGCHLQLSGADLPREINLTRSFDGPEEQVYEVETCQPDTHPND